MNETNKPVETVDAFHKIIDPQKVLVPLPTGMPMAGFRSKSHFYAQLAEGKAPKPIKLTKQNSVLRLSDIYAHNERVISEAAENQEGRHGE